MVVVSTMQTIHKLAMCVCLGGFMARISAMVLCVWFHDSSLLTTVRRVDVVFCLPDLRAEESRVIRSEAASLQSAIELIIRYRHFPVYFSIFVLS